MVEIIRRICNLTGVSWAFNLFSHSFFEPQFFDIRNLLVYNNILHHEEATLSETTTINDIPEEVMLMIFKKLEHSHLIKTSRVCKYWKELIDGSPSLWGSAEISLTKPPARSYLSYVYENEQDKTKRYVDCLISKRARLRYLTLHMHYFNNNHLKTLNNLFDKGCCSKLSEVKLEWYEQRFSCDKAHIFTSSFAFFLSTLALLSEHCEQSLHTLCCQLNFTDQSIPYITSFQNLRTLVIKCTPRVQHISHKHMTAVLANLNHLRDLVLTVTIEPHHIRPFYIRSASLVTLDLSNCVNFIMAGVDLPRLTGYRAVGLRCHRNCLPSHRGFCCFDVLKRGAKCLKLINDVQVREVDRSSVDLYTGDFLFRQASRSRHYSSDSSSADDYEDFALTAVQEAELKICFCPRHNKNEVSLRDSNASYSSFI